MTRDQRLLILGRDTVDEIHREMATVPPPSPEQIERLRRIFSRSGRKSPISNAA